MPEGSSWDTERYVAGLEKSRVVRIRVLLDPYEKVFRFGSGYVINDGLVLTAAHVLELTKGSHPLPGQGCEILAWGTAEWQPGTLRWMDVGSDG